MRTKPVIPREAAHRDVDEAVEYYLAEGSEQAALGFIDALAQAYRPIGRHPTTGSPRYAHELDLPGLRVWPLKRYAFHSPQDLAVTELATTCRNRSDSTPASASKRSQSSGGWPLSSILRKTR